MAKLESQASRISLDDFTEAAFSSVLRAMESRSQSEKKFPFGPIIFGIIWYPEWPEKTPIESVQPNISSKKE